MNDYAASFWLKRTLAAALERDPVDALNDAEILVKALRENLDDVYRAVNGLNNSDNKKGSQLKPGQITSLKGMLSVISYRFKLEAIIKSYWGKEDER
jgi:hypothetical protein